VIVAFSTSSPQTSVALIASDGEVLAAMAKHAPMQASAACMDLLQALLVESGLDLKSATLFAADRGPGSFTGVKVAVTIAKTMAFAAGVKVVGADSFNLIDPDGTVVTPSKRGEWFIRRPGTEAIRQEELPEEPYLGFGPGIEPPRYPLASGFARLLPSLVEMEPELLVPNYLIEPSISAPKTPYAERHAT